MKRFAVLGNPISHSKSPVIHKLFAQQLGHDIEYEALLAPEDDFQTFVKQLIDEGYSGCNVTLPFKEQAFAMATQLSDRARMAEAVNTLSFENGEVIADNTDGQGLVEDLCRLLGNIKNKSILLIGAGGAAKGTVLPLLEAGADRIVLTNRTLQKAEALKARFNSKDNVSVVDINLLEGVDVDIVINSTSSSLQNELPIRSAKPFESALLAYDMVYKTDLTVFEELALSANPDIKTASGFGMLVGQAAESYRIWNGIKPAIAPVIAQMCG